MVKRLLMGDHQCVINEITRLLSWEKGAYEDS